MGHEDPNDLGTLLAEMNRNIETLTARPTPGDIQEWVPNVKATVSGPNKGNNYSAVGRFVVTSHGTCHGSATIRFRSSMTRGNGYYMFKLPLPALVYDGKKATPLNGGITIGDNGVTHEVGGALHSCGLSGFESNLWAVATIQGGLFVRHDDPFPGTDLGNIHYWFDYFLDDEVIA